jgi:hypothetical protein
MTIYYVCITPGCIRNVRNNPRLHVKAATVESQGHSRCLECGRSMERRRRPLKGPNVKRIVGKTLGRGKAKASGGAKKPAGRKVQRKRLYKR